MKVAKYYTIYGDWNLSLPCPLIEHEDELYKELKRLNQIPNDGIVPVWSVESHAFLPHSTVIGHTQHCQTGLMKNTVWQRIKGTNACKITFIDILGLASRSSVRQRAGTRFVPY